MNKFPKSERSTLSYWFAHWCAFQMVALLCRAWKFKYLFHDMEKPWLMLLWRDYKKVQIWHRTHNRHHLEYKGKKRIDWDAYCIDNECSRFTKEASPWTCQQWTHMQYVRGKISADKMLQITSTLRKLGLYEEGASHVSE